MLETSATRSAQKADELDKYLKMPIDDKFKVANPLVFWQNHQDKLPYLAKLARQIYSIPATSAGVERQFSSAHSEKIHIAIRRTLSLCTLLLKK